MVIFNFFLKSKRSQLFTIISIFIVAIFSIFVTTMIYQIDSDSTYVDSKVTSMNNYYSLVRGSYLNSILQTSVRSALYAMSNFTIENGVFLPNGTEFKDIYRSLLMEGNFSTVIEGVPYTCFDACREIMANNTLQDWSSQLELLSEDVLPYISDFSVTPLPSTLEIYQTDPFNVVVSIYYNLSLVSNDFSFFDSDFLVETDVSLVGLYDPLLAYHSSGSLLQPIFKDPENLTSVENTWNVSSFKKAVEGHYYYQNDRGLSFLMRLQNISSPEGYSTAFANIESFIYPYYVYNSTAPLFIYNGTSPKRSFVDHLFFSPIYFLCDSTNDLHYFLYNVSEISDDSNLTGFRVDFNTTVWYSGTDFSDDYVAPSCSGSVGS